MRKDVSKNKLTARQKIILQIIYNYLKSSGFPPTLADLREALKIKSNQAVLEHLASLERKGFIKREEGSARGIRLLSPVFKALNLKPLIPFVGTSSAGFFIEAIEEISEWRELSEEVVKCSDNVYLIKIRGDSMIGAGINDGDIVLVKEAKEFRNGDIVLAHTSNGTTVKRLVFEDGRSYLKPENPKYPNIYFTVDDNLRIIGKVITNLGKI